MLTHHRRPGGMVEARHPEAGGVSGGPPRGGEVQPRGLEARGAAQALRAAGAQGLRRLRLVGRVVAGGHGARVAPCAHGRRRHRQDARGVGPLRAGVREGARGAPFRGVLARDAPEARPRRREARPGGPSSSAGLACSSSTSSGFSHSTRTGRGCSSGPSPTPTRDGRRQSPRTRSSAGGGRCSGTTGWPPP